MKSLITNSMNKPLYESHGWSFQFFFPCTLNNITINTTVSIDPLEQFEVLYGYFGFSFFSLTNLSLILFFVLTFLAFFGLIYIQVGYTNVHYFFEGTFKLVKNILRENLNIKKQQYFAIVFYLFLVILLSNLVGLIPYSFTITSSFIVTFFIALTHFIGINLIGVVQHQWHISNLFLSKGIPFAINPPLILIEVISYVSRVFSLSIRLFANMLSGHALLKILSGFSWTLLNSTSVILVFVSVFPWIIVTLIMFLELLIAYLQSYVFVILVTIYINDVLNLH